MSLLNGFSDVISRNNLCANSSFRINQRGNFTSYAVCNVNDYVADCWYIGANNTDYTEAIQSSNGYIELKGYGKKDQYIQINNKNTENMGYGNYNSNTRSLATEIVNIKNYSNSMSINVIINLKGDAADVYNPTNIIKTNSIGEAIKVSEIDTTSTEKSYIKIELKKDGEFYFRIYNFRQLAGAFRNPPGDCFVPYADDFQRCERYFQTGSFSGDVYVPFRTKMAGTPSVTLSSGTAGNISVDGFVTSGSSSVYTWTAEV